MEFSSLKSNFYVAFASQGVSMLLSILTSLLVPKVLGVVEFGYWQLFIFYSSYVGFFHLGLNDGVYLINGGKTRDTIDKASVASQFSFGILFQSLFSILIVAVALFGPFEHERQFVIAATAVFLLLNNTTLYLGYVFQAINETRLFSISIMVDRLVFLLPLLVLIVVRCPSFEIYIIFYALSKTCALSYCLYQARDMFGEGLYRFSETVQESLQSMRVGIKLTLANITGFLILGIVRFLVDANWGISVFGEFSLAVSMVNFIMTFVSQVSMVLFPALRRTGKGELQRFYSTTRSLLDVLLPVCYLLYFPGAALLKFWLPQYQDALSYFALLLPICVYNGRMDILGTTYFKVLRKESSLLLLNIATVMLSAAGALSAAYLFHSIELMAFLTVIAVVVRCILGERYICLLLGARNEGGGTRFLGYALTCVYIASVLLLPVPLAFSICALFYIAVAFTGRKRVVFARKSAGKHVSTAKEGPHDEFRN